MPILKRISNVKSTFYPLTPFNKLKNTKISKSTLIRNLQLDFEKMTNKEIRAK